MIFKMINDYTITIIGSIFIGSVLAIVILIPLIELIEYFSKKVNIEKLKIYILKSLSFYISIIFGFIGIIFLESLFNHFDKRKKFKENKKFNEYYK